MKAQYRRKINISITSAPTIALFLVAAVLILSGPSFSEPSKDPEEAAVLQAARNFLDAETSRDFKAVYACLAPSSPYADTHSYDDYLREALAAEDHVVDYTIVGVTFIQDNDDRETWPSVEKFAQVEVDVVYLHLPTKQISEINIGFIFIREGGRWYKS